jgi:hypothetical protein
VVLLSGGWLYVVARLRRSYLDLFRQALARGTLDPAATSQELDLTSIETVMDALSSRDARRVLAAMDLLDEKRRARLIPGLILYHESPEVLVRALRIITSPERTDWPPLAERLLGHAAEGVRVEALRALGRIHHHVAVVRALDDESPAVRAHAAFWAARDGDRGPEETGRVRELLALEGEEGTKARAALLDAVRDAPDPRFANLVLAVLRGAPAGEGALAGRAAEAMQRLGDPRFVPLLVRALGRREGRAAVRAALVHQGDAAFEALARALGDPGTDGRLRIHLPESIAAFGTQRAADVLAAHLRDERSGAVRYKALRGLGHVVAHGAVKVDHAAIEVLAQQSLVTHLRLLALATRLGARREGDAGAALEILRGLLDDKMRQSLERAFRLLQIVHPTEDIQGAYLALRGADKRLRAQAMEFLDTLTLAGDRASPGHRALREALRIVADDLGDADRVVRARGLLPGAPGSEAEAVALLLRDGDEGLALLAKHYVRARSLQAEAALRGAALTEAIDGGS